MDSPHFYGEMFTLLVLLVFDSSCVKMLPDSFVRLHWKQSRKP